MPACHIRARFLEKFDPLLGACWKRSDTKGAGVPAGAFSAVLEIDNYVAAAASNDFVSVLCMQSDEVVGVALTRRNFAESAELHLIGVSPNLRRQGIGHALIEHIAGDLLEDGCLMLSVHTVGPSVDNEPYAQTRAFYRAAGFLPLEEHINLNWPGPSVILVRNLRAQTVR